MSEKIVKPIYLEKNGGLGNALKVALEHCSNELVARMDSDDVSFPQRFEFQLDYLKRHPETDIVGGNITEFIGSEENIIGQRSVPYSNQEIKTFMKSRCPFNHMTVMFKKSVIAEAGGYQDWFWNEDYYLWIRMMEKRAIMANIPQNLVNVRVGSEMSSRRGGMKYFKSEKGLQKYMLQHHIISIPQYLYNTVIRFGGEVIAPNWLRTKLFKFTRNKVSNNKKLKKTKVDQICLKDEEFEAFPFSVAMCVYNGDNPKWLEMAIISIVNQTVKPKEIILVVDGPIKDEIKIVIEKYTFQHK